ncbi:MAG: 6-pyruvoyl trahydropterin synthase family protein [Thermoplasmatota archaeon]
MDNHIQIDGWSRNIRFSACHVLLHHEKCSRLHGHSYAIHLKLKGSLGEDNFLIDFGRIKSVLKRYAGELDHKALVPTENDDIDIDKDDETGTVTMDMCGKRYQFPIGDVVFLPIPATTVEELSGYILKRLLAEVSFPPGATEISLGIDEGPGQGAWVTEVL